MVTIKYMKAVGIKELKAKLSEYVRLVKTGETVLVTERDEVVAELRPPRLTAPPATTIEETLARMADAGELVPAAHGKLGWTWKPAGLGLADGTAAAILDDVRGERGEP